MPMYSFVILYVVAEIWTTCVCSSVENGDTNTSKLSDEPECRNVVYQFGGSRRQCIIKKELDDAIEKVSMLQNRSEENVGEQLQELLKRIQGMVRGIDGKLEQLEAFENRIEEKLDRIAEKISPDIDNARSCNRTCPIGYEYYQPDKFCYRVHKVCKSWYDARDVCRQDGGDLISLKSSNFEFFNEVARSSTGFCFNSYVWVGATDIGSAGTWFWLNGEKILSTFWYPGEPNNPVDNEHCAFFNYFPSKLDDYLCSTESNFLCQIYL
ncbi:hypothetical protein ACJMK2_040818 [Sinanodonta woodiana]|uniref:C-type lectin domain-containing protein n=1 Tax=Sinanodonta woodiana TaxID=1069815 RepID=A0ABD3W269_SINWO